MLLLETIRMEAGSAAHLEYHQRRFEKSRNALFGLTRHPQLSSHISPPTKARYRCRILYEEEIVSVEYLPYTPRKIKRLKILQSDMDYSYKYADRHALEHLMQARGDADEIIIEKAGLLSDTSIANIAFYDGEHWLTPKTPLLEGTVRARLLDEGFLQPADITRNALCGYTHVALMNAMIGFKILNQADIR